MYKIIAVGLGGCIGAILRYLISGWSLKLLGSAFPYGTLIVNILGGFLIAFIMQIGIETWTISPTLRIFLTTGLLGGLTTFSTFSYETLTILSGGDYLRGGLNIGLNIVLCLTGAWLGKSLAQII